MKKLFHITCMAILFSLPSMAQFVSISQTATGFQVDNPDPGLRYDWQYDTPDNACQLSVYTYIATGTQIPFPFAGGYISCLSFDLVTGNQVGQSFNSLPYLACPIFEQTFFGKSICVAGNLNSCSGNPPVFTANGIGAMMGTIQWQRNNVDLPGSTGQSFTPTQSGTYRCRYVSCNQYSENLVVTLSSPSATITPNGNLNFCSGSGVTLQANTGAGLTYQWRKNSVNIAGATNSSYLANSTGSFNVIVTNSSGCSKGATPVNVTSPPSITITPSGPTHFCTGGSVTLTATSGQTVTYKWKKNGAYISGATNSSYVATTSGSYNCIVTNSFGCSKGGTPIAVTGPPSSVITANGPTTFCAGGSVQLSAQSGYTYQWIKNSGNINGATQQNYTATTAGNYKVKVTDAFGCSKTTPNANQITVSVPCREGHFTNEINQGLTIYPNPSTGIFEMMIPSAQNKNAEIEIYSPDGRLIKKQIVETNNPFTIDLSQQTNGIYFIHALIDGELVSKKIVKQ